MDTVFTLIVAALAVLAIIDLIVGVSNDAVNFLNSAIGSRAISFKKILIIASLGIFIGAVFSSGMMEVARKGIFNPGEFFFDEIMFIFLAVMIGDILLLDFFNTIGMPTSTTVSIVFNLLGAAVVMSLIKIGLDDTQGLGDIVKYINNEKAIEIISGILLSVVISFTIGALIQWISRLVFTFQYERKIKNFGVLFAAACLTSISYFIFYKGLKGTPYYNDISEILETKGLFIVGGMFLFWTIISWVVDRVFKKNILVLVIGAGTFGLALAFSGNDLVNFIGVPMAAFHSFEAWSASGVPASEFSMGVLSKKVPAEPLLLFLSGGIMVTTLWLSKKAKTVTETEINLSRQSEGSERFEPNLLSKLVVRVATFLSSAIGHLLPQFAKNRIESSFKVPIPNISSDKAKELPAFDLIRASINLTIAGILISIATSMSLPLSTTYVTFMVAMGTSLADRAWGRESAVYRVAGVINVIAGWFFTAFIAFVFAGILTYLIYLGKGISIILLLMITAALLVRNYVNHKKKQVEKLNPKVLRKSKSKTVQGIINESSENVADVISRANKINHNIIDGLTKQSIDKLRKAKKQISKLEAEIEDLRNHLFYFIKNLDEKSVNGSNFYMIVLACLTDIAQSLDYIARKSFKHIENQHKPLTYNQCKDLNEIQEEFSKLLINIEKCFLEKNFKGLSQVVSKKKEINALITIKIDNQIARTRSSETSPKNTTLFFNILLEAKDLLNSIISVSEEYYRSSKG
ncbi:MAG: inorganic phosphate transporter [Flavobacteriaceae bacterium]